jgi:hypothetical protein
MDQMPMNDCGDTLSRNKAVLGKGVPRRHIFNEAWELLLFSQQTPLSIPPIRISPSAILASKNQADIPRLERNQNDCALLSFVKGCCSLHPTDEDLSAGTQDCWSRQLECRGFGEHRFWFRCRRASARAWGCEDGVDCCSLSRDAPLSARRNSRILQPPKSFSNLPIDDSTTCAAKRRGVERIRI